MATQKDAIIRVKIQVVKDAAVRELLADAWDDGHLMGWNEATANTLPERESLWRNPYRTTK
jgi:hypothetical protein